MRKNREDLPNSYITNTRQNKNHMLHVVGRANVGSGEWGNGEMGKSQTDRRRVTRDALCK